jgi:hypothetical protein
MCVITLVVPSPISLVEVAYAPTGEGDIASEVGSEDAGVEISVLSTVKAWPQDESRVSVEEEESTVKTSAQEEVWAVERPRRERRRVVLRRLDLRILGDCVEGGGML